MMGFTAYIIAVVDGVQNMHAGPTYALADTAMPRPGEGPSYPRE